MKIGILGAGTWGIALARLLSEKGYDVSVWSALPEEIKKYSKERKHPFLPDMKIPEEIKFTADMEEACAKKDLLVFAVPSVFMRGTAEKAAFYIQNGEITVTVAKGIEEDTFFTMTQILEDEFSKRHVQAELAVLSGPTHAEEVARDLPTTIVAASKNLKTAEYIQQIFSNDNMRVYTNEDVLGVELCGALKNIMALASGISSGMGFGDNTKAALITRGMAEMKRLGLKMGCAESTFYGLAGIGDLIVTATSRHSRNNKAGYLIGQGMSAKEATEQVGMVVEGINALPAAVRLSEKYDVEMPIVEAVDRIVRCGSNPESEIKTLMRREMKMESDR